MPETLFNICRFLLNNLTKDVPPGISKVYPSTAERSTAAEILSRTWLSPSYRGPLLPVWSSLAEPAEMIKG